MTKPCTLHQVSDHVYWYSPDGDTDRPSLGLVVGEEKVLMLDAGNSPAHVEGFLQATRSQNLPEPTHVFVTHAHWDHFFGLEALDAIPIAHHQTVFHIERQSRYDWTDVDIDKRIQQGIEVEFVREHLQREMTESQRLALNFVVPTWMFYHHLRLDLGGVTVRLSHVGGDHAADSSIAYIETDQVLFLGDCLYSTVYELPQHYTALELSKLTETLAGLAVQAAIEGHSPELLTRSEFDVLLQTMHSLSKWVLQYGNDRERILQEWKQSSTLPLTDDVHEILDEILAGT